MFPGINPRQMKQMMRQMGIKQEEINADQVIIKCNDKNIIFDNPQIMKINMRGEESFQITGEYHEESIDSEPEINEDDIKTVVEATNASHEEAKSKLIENKGDIAKTILDLKK